MNKLFDSPVHNRIRENEKDKNEKEKINNFNKAHDKKYSISPTLHIKKEQNSNNSEIGEFKLELRSKE